MQIGNAIGNLPELIRPGWNGFLLEAPELVPVESALHHSRLNHIGSNLDWYIDRLAWCQAHPSVVVTMGEQARQTVLERWTWGHQVEHVRKMWREVLG